MSERESANDEWRMMNDEQSPVGEIKSEKLKIKNDERSPKL